MGRGDQGSGQAEGGEVIGMLWFDNSTLSLADKVDRAAAYYAKKYGRPAEVCLVNPAALEGQKLPDNMVVTVRAYRPVLPAHFWIGIEDKRELLRSEKSE